MHHNTLVVNPKVSWRLLNLKKLNRSLLTNYLEFQIDENVRKHRTGVRSAPQGFTSLEKPAWRIIWKNGTLSLVFILQFIFLIEIQRHEIAEPNAEHYRLDGRYLHPATAFFLTDKKSNLQVIRDEIERYYLDPKTPVIYGTLSTYD